jgi:O-antigen/teichoic acid export membrane protein
MDRNALTKTSLLLTAQVVVSAITLFGLYKFIFRTLGPANLGLYSLVLATTGVARFTDLGLSGSLGRFVARYRALNNQEQAGLVIETGVISVVTILAVVCLLAFPLLLIVLRNVVPVEKIAMAKALLPWAVASIVVGSGASAIQGALDGCTRLDLRAILVTAANVVFVMLAVVLSHFHGLIGLAWAQLIQALLLIVFGWATLRRVLPCLPAVPFRWRWTLFREMLGYATAYQVAGISLLFCDPLTKGLIAKFGSLADVGIFEMANRVILQVRSLVIAPQQPVLPLAAGAEEKGGGAVTRLYAQAFKGLVAVLLPTVAVLVASAPLVSLLWLGSINWLFVHLVVVLALAHGLQMLTVPAYFALLGVGRASSVAAGNLVSALGNLVFGVPLGLYCGIAGVIAGSIAAMLAGSALLIILFHRQYAIPRSVLAPAGALYPLLLITAAIFTEVCIEIFPERTFFTAFAPWAATLFIGASAIAVALNNPVLAPLARQGWWRLRDCAKTSYGNG